MLAQLFLFGRSDRRKIPLRQLPRCTKTNDHEIFEKHKCPYFDVFILKNTFWVHCHFNESYFNQQVVVIQKIFFCHLIEMCVWRSNITIKMLSMLNFLRNHSWLVKLLAKKKKQKYFITISRLLTFRNGPKRLTSEMYKFR